MNNYAFKSQEDQPSPKKNNNSFVSLSLQQKREIDEVLLECIIGADLPHNMAYHSSVIQFLKVRISEYTPPNRRTHSSRIIYNYNEYINDLKDIASRGTISIFK